MALRPVPWAIGHGAHNAVEGARLSLHAGTRGARGVMSPTDMRVTALPVPGGAVRIHKGAAVMPNDYVPGSSQAYAVEEQSSTDFPIPPTGSAGGAVRYLVARVMDDQYAGQAPTDVINGPYNDYAWLSSDPRVNPPSYPWTLLARINQPANTATITQAMTTDLRQVANPQIKDDWIARPTVNAHLTGWSHILRQAKNGTGDDRGEQFPDGPHGGEFAVFCPTWATYVLVEFTWSGIRCSGQNAWGGYYLQYTDGTTWRSSQDFGWDQLEAGYPYVTEWTLAEKLYLPPSMRGKTLRFYPRAFRDVNSPNTGITMTNRSGLNFRARFLEVADASLSA